MFGRRDSRETQKALRFFRERRINPSFVDLAQRPIAPAELRRFAQRFGAAALVDQASRSYTETGMAYLRFDDDELLEHLHADQRLLRLPLVRAGDRLSVGLAEQEWRGWLN